MSSSDEEKPRKPVREPKRLVYLKATGLIISVAQVRTIPQFKSFKTATTSTTTTKSAESLSKAHSEIPRDDPNTSRKHKHESKRGKDDEGRDHRSHRSDRDTRHRDGESRRTDSRTHRSRSRERHRRRSPSHTKQVTQDPDPSIIAWDTPDLPYQVDTRGDAHNITYGTIHRYNIPQYRRIGAGAIMGLDKRLKIDREKGDGKGLVIDDLHNDGRKGWRRTDYDYAVEYTKLLKVKIIQDSSIEDNRDFIQLSNKVKPIKAIEEPKDYRSIYGPMPNDGQEEDPELESASSSSDDEAMTFDARVRAESIRLARLTDSEPHNIDAWLDLVNHQESLLLGIEDGRKKRKVKQGEKQGLEEVKLSILEKALGHNKGNIILLSRYMQTGARIWE